MNCLIRIAGLMVSGSMALGAVGCDGGSDNSSGAQAGTGGSSGSGGESGAGGTPVVLEESPIDDMEDTDGSIFTAEGRVGAWYTYNDGTGTQSPAAGEPDFQMSAIAPPRAASAYAAHTMGESFSEWGAGFGFDLNNDGTAKGPHDASGYAGIVFWAKRGPGGIANIRVNFHDQQTAPEGGICNDAAAECNDHYGTTVVLGDDWKQYVLRFDELKQQGWGKAFPTFMIDKLFAIQFQAGKDVAFDIWVDDVAFFK